MVLTLPSNWSDWFDFELTDRLLQIDTGLRNRNKTGHGFVDSVYTNRSNIEELIHRYLTMDERVEKTRELAEENRDWIVDNEGELNQITDTIAENKNDIVNLDGMLSTARDDITTLRNDLDNLDLDDLPDDLVIQTELDNVQTELEDNIDNLQGVIDALGIDDIGGLSGELGTLETNLDDLRALVSNLSIDDLELGLPISGTLADWRTWSKETKEEFNNRLLSQISDVEADLSDTIDEVEARLSFDITALEHSTNLEFNKHWDEILNLYDVKTDDTDVIDLVEANGYLKQIGVSDLPTTLQDVYDNWGDHGIEKVNYKQSLGYTAQTIRDRLDKVLDLEDILDTLGIGDIELDLPVSGSLNDWREWSRFTINTNLEGLLDSVINDGFTTTVTDALDDAGSYIRQSHIVSDQIVPRNIDFEGLLGGRDGYSGLFPSIDDITGIRSKMDTWFEKFKTGGDFDNIFSQIEDMIENLKVDVLGDMDSEFGDLFDGTMDEIRELVRMSYDIMYNLSACAVNTSKAIGVYLKNTFNASTKSAIIRATKSQFLGKNPYPSYDGNIIYGGEPYRDWEDGTYLTGDMEYKDLTQYPLIEKLIDEGIITTVPDASSYDVYTERWVVESIFHDLAHGIQEIILGFGDGLSGSNMLFEATKLGLNNTTFSKGLLGTGLGMDALGRHGFTGYPWSWQ